MANVAAPGDDAENERKAHVARDDHRPEQIAHHDRRNRGRAGIPLVECLMVMVVSGDHHDRDSAETHRDDCRRSEGLCESRR